MLTEVDLKGAEALLANPDAEDCERFASRFGRSLIDDARLCRDLLAALKDARGAVMLWIGDVECGVKPTVASLQDTLDAIRAACLKADRPPVAHRTGGCGAIDCVNHCGGDFTWETCPHAISQAEARSDV